MASKKAGQIVITLSSGQAQFISDMDRAKARVVDFGAAARRMGSDMHGTVTGVQATSGALRVLEGGITNNLRAAERFTANVLGLGPALQAAFPVVGAIAFAGILVKLGEEANNFLEQLKTAPERMSNAFREVNAPLRQTSDELAVANARLQNDIDKLLGRRENFLTLTLAEARVAADKLADALDNDLQKISEVMKKNEVGFFNGLFTGRQSTGGNTEAQEKFAADMARINAEGLAAVRTATAADQAAKDQKQTQTRAAQDAWNAKVSAALDAEIKKQERLLELAELQQKIHQGTASQADREKAYDLKNPGDRKPGQIIATNRTAPDQTLNIIESQKRLEDLNYAKDIHSQTVANETLSRQKNVLGQGAANAALGRPFEDRMKALDAQLSGITARMAAIGEGAGAEVLAKSFAEATKAIAEINKALEEHHTKLTKNQEDQIRAKELAISTAEAESAWKSKIDSTNDSIENRIKSQKLLTDAIGKGYEAARRASVETSVMAAVPKGMYGDKEWESQQSDTPGVTHGQQVDALRKQFGTEYDSQHAEQTGKAVYALQQQIELEKSLAKVQAQGAEAVRLVELAYRLKAIALNNTADAAKKLAQAEVLQYTAERDKRIASQVAKLDEETAATERLTAAMFKGADAVRKAGLENKYAAMQRDLGVSADASVIQKARTEDEAKYQEQVTEEAAKMATHYSDALDRISRLTAKLQEQKAIEGDTVGIETALRDLENERLHILAEQALQMGSLKDGVHAFFLDMQQSAEKASTIIYDALHSALDKSSEELANLLTGEKTHWGEMFKSIGHKMVQDSIKSLLQTGLGKLGGSGAKADGSRSNPFYVVSANGSIGAPGSGQVGDIVGNGDTLAGTGQSSGGPWDEVFRAGSDGYRDGGALGAAGNVGVTLLEKLFHVGKSKSGGAIGKPDGSAGNPFGVYIALNRADGTRGNPFYVVMSQSGAQSKPIDFGPNMAKPAGPNGLQKAGGIISGIASTVAGAFGLPIPNLSGVGGGSSGGGGSASENVHYDMGPYGGGSSVPDSGDFGGGLATGGPVRTGKHYLVGERGPELFRSGTAGHIIDHETTKRMARAGMLPEGIKIPGIGPKPFSSARMNAFTDGGKGKVGNLPTASPKQLTPRADGGSVSAGDSYIVGERGAETFMPGNLAADQGSRRTEGGGNTAYYTIDARGTDPNLVEMRVRQALVQVHKSAISTAIQGNVERSKRVPG